MNRAMIRQLAEHSSAEHVEADAEHVEVDAEHVEAHAEMIILHHAVPPPLAGIVHRDR